MGQIGQCNSSKHRGEVEKNKEPSALLINSRLSVKTVNDKSSI